MTVGELNKNSLEESAARMGVCVNSGGSLLCSSSYEDPAGDMLLQ